MTMNVTCDWIRKCDPPYHSKQPSTSSTVWVGFPKKPLEYVVFSGVGFPKKPLEAVVIIWNSFSSSKKTIVEIHPPIFHHTNGTMGLVFRKNPNSLTILFESNLFFQNKKNLYNENYFSFTNKVNWEIFS